MAASSRRKKTTRKTGRPSGTTASRSAAARKKTRQPAAGAGAAGPVSSDDRSILEQLEGLADSVREELGERLQSLALDTGTLPLRLGRALLLRPENPAMAKQAGASLRELRELAGLTLDELSEAVELKDHSLLRAVEEGTATLSFELILRLAALLARHDPIPFVIRFTRTYNPELWRFLEAWGIGRLPLQYEREREFVNVFRRHDAARALSDEGFARVLDFTRSAFELALHFVAEEEEVEDREIEPDTPD